MIAIKNEEFVKNAKIKFPQNDYSITQYINKRTKIKFICPIHGIMQQLPVAHIKSKFGCRICSGLQPITTNEFITQAKEKFTQFDYSITKYYSQNKYIQFICPKHGIVSTIAYVFLHSTHGCTYCSGAKKHVYSFIEQLKEKFPQNDYSITEYKNNKVPIQFICPIHGIVSQLPAVHLKSVYGCSSCSGLKISNTQSFVEKAKKIFNNIFDYSFTTYTNSHEPVNIICPKHGTFATKPYTHINSPTGNCPDCSTNSYTQKRVMEILEGIYGTEKYDLSNVHYMNNRTKIEIICKIHGSFFITPNNIFQKHAGCQKCGKPGTNKTQEEFILEVSKIHNNKYSYANTKYIKANDKIEIICPKHGSFWQIATDHRKGSGCRLCKESKGEIAIEKCFIDKNISVSREHKFDDCISLKNKHRLPFDFYVESLNKLVIEFDGRLHFEQFSKSKNSKIALQNIKYTDNIKTQYCIDSKKPLLRIHYKDQKNINEILDKCIYIIQNKNIIPIDNKIYITELSILYIS